MIVGRNSGCARARGGSAVVAGIVTGADDASAGTHAGRSGRRREIYAMDFGNVLEIDEQQEGLTSL